MYEKLDKWLSKEVLGAAAIILVGVGAFGLGKLSAIEAKKQPFSIEMLTSTSTPAASSSSAFASTTSLEEPKKTLAKPVSQTAAAVVPVIAPTTQTKGEVVASKSGKVYYLPICSGAKRILPENQRWFKTIADARAAGLTPSSTCKGLK